MDWMTSNSNSRSLIDHYWRILKISISLFHGFANKLQSSKFTPVHTCYIVYYIIFPKGSPAPSPLCIGASSLENFFVKAKVMCLQSRKSCPTPIQWAERTSFSSEVCLALTRAPSLSSRWYAYAETLSHLTWAWNYSNKDLVDVCQSILSKLHTEKLRALTSNSHFTSPLSHVVKFESERVVRE